MNLQERSYDDAIVNPDQPLRAVNTPISTELLHDRLKADMRTLIEIHCAEGHEFRDIDAMVKDCIINVYMPAHGYSQTKASIALNVNRSTIRKWNKRVVENELNDADKLTTDEL